jgi:hypothetical protein
VYKHGFTILPLITFSFLQSFACSSLSVLSLDLCQKYQLCAWVACLPYQQEPELGQQLELGLEQEWGEEWEWEQQQSVDPQLQQK